jgi:eukaryotic-like serine/threonine-protein kinase
VANFGERYELIRRIGAGGMGEVWLAHDEEVAGRPVAIKIMHRHMLPNAEDVARFEGEMRFAAMMSHPNIVTMYTTGTYDGAPFMVMEYLRGNDLERALPGSDAEQIAGIGRDICNGLAHAHREGVLHRDIKPANLFLCESGEVKITDFGLARAVGGKALSTVGVLVGTLAYLPPERWRGAPPAFGNDVWAAGCVLYRLICGQLPRALADVADYSAAATRGDPVPHLRDFTDAPARLADPVMAMLADDPADRPAAADCAQLLSSARLPAPAAGRPVRSTAVPGQAGSGRPEPGAAIGAAREEPTVTSMPGPAAARAAAGRSRRPGRPVVVAGGVALLLTASLIGWRLSASPRISALPAPGASAPPPASHAAAEVPGSSGSASRSGATAVPPDPGTTTAAPVASRSGSAVASRSGSPVGSRSASLPGSPAASPASAPAASPSASTPASSSPALVPIPDVIGMNFPQAQRLLKSDGFTVAGRHTPPGVKVVSTSPSGEAPAGSTITVVYG